MGGKDAFGLSKSDKTFAQELYVRDVALENERDGEKVPMDTAMDSDGGHCFGKYVFKLMDAAISPEDLLKWKSFRIRKATWTIDYKKALVPGAAGDIRQVAGQSSSFNVFPILDRSRSYIDGGGATGLTLNKYLSFAPPKYSLNNSYPTLNIKQLKPNFRTAVASMGGSTSVAVGIDSYKFMDLAGGSTIEFAGLVVMLDGVGNFHPTLDASIDEYIRVGLKLVVEFRGNRNV